METSIDPLISNLLLVEIKLIGLLTSQHGVHPKEALINRRTRSPQSAQSDSENQWTKVT